MKSKTVRYPFSRWLGIWSVFIGIITWGYGEDISNLPSTSPSPSFLTPLKEQKLELERKSGNTKGDEIKWGWVSPVTITYSINRNDQRGIVRTKTFQLQMNQPIFKSGAIYYSIKYGRDITDLNRLNYKKSRAQLVKEAVATLLDYKIAQLNLQIGKLQLENSKIEVQKRREEYSAGVGDSGLLNSAVLKKNGTELQLLEIEEQLNRLRERFKTLSNLNIDSAPIPHFRLLSEQKFVNSNYNYLIARQRAKVNYDLYRQAVGNALFSVNLVGSYTKLRQVEPFTTSDSYYSVGIAISLPIAPSNYFKVKEQKLNYLKSRLEIGDIRHSLLHTYRQLLTQLKRLQKELKIYRQNANLYRQLIQTTRDGIKAGTKTVLDLKMMENSYKIAQLQEKVVYYKKQKVLLELEYQIYQSRFPENRF